MTSPGLRESLRSGTDTIGLVTGWMRDNLRPTVAGIAAIGAASYGYQSWQRYRNAREVRQTRQREAGDTVRLTPRVEEGANREQTLLGAVTAAAALVYGWRNGLDDGQRENVRSAVRNPIDAWRTLRSNWTRPSNSHSSGSG